MPKIVAVMIELVVFLCALWATAFLSAFLHELGHAIGYILSTGGRRWHIRLGSGKTLFETKALTVKLIILDGYFCPAENRIDSKGNLISMLSGGPVVSLVLVIMLLLLRFGGISFNSDMINSSAIEFFVSFALFYNMFILFFSVIPADYFCEENKGMETDGRKILNAIIGKKAQ